MNIKGMTTDLYNLKREKIGTVELPDSLFAVRWNAAVVKQVLDAQISNKHDVWAHAKNRSEVRGGGKKPWRQKGTGHARHGSIRSPLWSGGGKAHGPHNERDYSRKVNKKVRRTAIAMLFSKKLKDEELSILGDFHIENPKTKTLAVQLREFTALPKRKKNFDVLLIPKTEEKDIMRAGSNLPKTKVTHPESINVYDLLNYKHILLDQGAVAEMVKRYSTKK